MKIKKGLKIGLIIGSSIISVGGAAMMFAGGMATYNYTTFEKNEDGTLKGITTKQYGIGLFNFDNTSPDTPFSDSKQTYNDTLDRVNKMTSEEKTQVVDLAKKAVEEAKAQDIPEPYKDWLITSTESALTFSNAFVSMPTMHGLAIAGVIFLPIGLLILIGSLFIKTKAKKTD